MSVKQRWPGGALRDLK